MLFFNWLKIIQWVINFYTTDIIEREGFGRYAFAFSRH